MNIIDELVSASNQLCSRPVARERDEAERWLSDFNLYTRARMRFVRALPDQLKPTVEKATLVWEERKESLLNEVGCDEPTLLQLVGEAIEFGEEETTPPNSKILSVGEEANRQQTVRNIDWVHAFAWILPLADGEHATAYRSIGRMMAAIMYCEAKFKNSRDGITRHRVLWDIAHEN